MKKAIFLLLAIGFTSFGIYSCQKDTAEKAVDSATPNIGVSDRSFADCDACYETCLDCCLTFTRNAPGHVAFAYIDDMGNIKTEKLTSVTAQSVTVCARGGYLAILAAGGSGTITVCGSAQAPVTRTGVNKQGNLNIDGCVVNIPL